MDKCYKWVYIRRIVSAKGVDMDTEGLSQTIFRVAGFLRLLKSIKTHPIGFYYVV